MAKIAANVLSAERKPAETLAIVRQLRFTKEEWDAAVACGEADYGGMKPYCVIRTALRVFLKKRGYLG